MNIIFTMCLTGSFLFVLYLLTYYFFKKSLNSSWSYTILRIVVFFFLTPLGLIKLFFQQAMPSANFRLDGYLPFQISTPQGMYTNIVYQANTVIVFVWLGMAFSIFIWQQLKYFRLKKLVTKSMSEIRNSELEGYIDMCRQAMGIRRKVKLYQSNYASPFTTGVFCPIIVLPANLPIEKQKLITKHELIHIKRYDIFFLLLRQLVTCFYWFNPLVYILDIHLERMAEISCDQAIILDMEPKDRNDYANLIIDIAAFDVQYKSAYVSSFSHNMICLKERMEYIMLPEKKKNRRNMWSILLTASMVICSSVTAFAYQPPTKFSMDWDPSFVSFSGMGFSDYVTFTSGSYSDSQAARSILYENQFTDNYGNIYKINQRSDTPYATCSHDFEDGTYTKHTKKGKGCVVRYYESQRCSKCGYVTTGTLIDTETHDICPHKQIYE